MSQSFCFNVNEFMSRHILGSITEIPESHPEVILEQAAVLAIHVVIHDGVRADDAFAQIAQNEVKAFGALTRWIK